MTEDNSAMHKKCVSNCIVCLTKYILKCNFCNVFIPHDEDSVNDHCKSKKHVMLVEKTQIKLDFFSSDMFTDIFNNKLVMSFPSLAKTLNDPQRFETFCYQCIELIFNGENGLKTHLVSDAHINATYKSNQFCKTCKILVADLCSHTTSEFHKEIEKNLRYYDVKIPSKDTKGTFLKLMPKKCKNIYEYVNVMKSLILSEQEYRKAYFDSFMRGVTIRWEDHADSPKVYLIPVVSDYDFFKIKMYDELVISSASSQGCEMKGYVIQLQTFFNEEICIKVTNGSGLKNAVTYPYNVQLKWKPTVFLRLKEAIVQFKKTYASYPFLLSAVLNYPSLEFPIHSDDLSDVQIDTFDLKLNDSQITAVKMALTEPLLLIQGPPGTGKTEIITVVIRNLLKSSSIKVLVCAQSNLAVDVLAKKVDAAGIQLIRLFSRKFENVNNPLKRLGVVEQVLRKNENLRRDYKKYTDKQMKDDEELKYKNALAKATSDLFIETQVVFCTCTTAGSKEFKRKYDVVIIDDAAQALEPECLIPVIMHQAQKLILVGDHQQLQPLVMCKDAITAGLTQSLFERLIEQKNVKSIMLNTQYRMHPLIAQFSSETFYDNKIKNGIAAKDRNLVLNFLGIKKHPIVFFDIDGSEEKIGTSFLNVSEALKVLIVLSNKYILLELD